MTTPALTGPPTSGPAYAINPQTYLPERLHQALTLAANGHTNRSIGNRLGVDENTVKTHMRDIFSLLHVDNRAQAVAVALRLQILRMDDITLPPHLRRIALNPRQEP